MKILLTGATGYIGTRLLRLLTEEGHTVIALVRNVQRMPIPDDVLEKAKIVLGKTYPKSIVKHEKMR